MVLDFTYASYKVLTTTGVKQVESGKIEEVGGAISDVKIKKPLSKINQSHINKHNINSLKKHSLFLTEN
ncbi:hypothetical protein CYK55_07560 [Enterococcus mundtii]|nr:hypothetical protein CYK55_07560 [Enterococcus mundtii]